MRLDCYRSKRHSSDILNTGSFDDWVILSNTQSVLWEQNRLFCYFVLFRFVLCIIFGFVLVSISSFRPTFFYIFWNKITIIFVWRQSIGGNNIKKRPFGIQFERKKTLNHMLQFVWKWKKKRYFEGSSSEKLLITT